MFIPLQEAYLGEKVIYFMYALRTLLGATSFLVLLVFGLRVLWPRIGWLHKVTALGLFVLWLSIFLAKLSSVSGMSLLFADTFSRYLLGLPSSLLTAAAFYFQAKRVREPRLSQDMTRSVRALAVVFVFYAFFAGVVVSSQPFSPANYVNTGWFFRLTDMPVQVFRAICGTYMMVYTLQLLAAFNRETEYLLFQAKEEALRLAERERIGRDLHDGVIQTLYSAELMIESCQFKLQPDSPLQDDLQKSIKTLDIAMHDLRGYIMGLKKETLFQEPLQEMFQQIADEFRNEYPIVVELQFEANSHRVLSPNRQDHLYHVLKELLNNVAKHAGADQVDILVQERKRQLFVSVTDNGSGIPEECLEPGGCQGLGLKNMRERIAILRGEIIFKTPLRGGTLVTLAVPKEVKNDYGGSFAYRR